MVFSPENEPYLGRRSLHAFDDVIVASLKSNEKIAPFTRQTEKSEIQWAACQLIPAGISLALSVRELIRQGYLYGALVLMRSLAERATTVSYLRKCPEAVPLWTDGWKHGKRPSMSIMLSRIGPEELPNVGREVTKILNSLVHGDPASAAWNVIRTGHDAGHAVSMILDRPDLCGRAAGEGAFWMALLLVEMHVIFPDAFGEIR